MPKPKYDWDSSDEESLLPTFQPVQYKYGSFIWGVVKLPPDGSDSRTNATVPLSKRVHAFKNHRETMVLIKLLNKFKTHKIPFSALPVPFHGNQCNVKEPIRYMKKHKSRCKVSIGQNLRAKCENLNELNAAKLLQDVMIYEDPSVLPNSTLIKPTRFICYKTKNGKQTCAMESKVPNYSPKIDNATASCQNVLQRLNMTIFHDGVAGIKKIRTEYLLVNLSLEETSQFFQEFIVSYKWMNASFPRNETYEWSDIPIPRVYDRSGNPGYLVGKPVIIGRKIPVNSLPTDSEDRNNSTTGGKQTGKEDLDDSSNNSEGADAKKHSKKPENIILIDKENYWMDILAPGFCPETKEQLDGVKRKPVAFDYGHSSSCSLDTRKFKYCYDLQTHIARILFGNKNYMDQQKRQWYVK